MFRTISTFLLAQTLLTLNTVQASPLVLGDDFKEKNLSQEFEYLIDQTSNMTIMDALESYKQGQFKLKEGGSTNFGYINSPLWSVNLLSNPNSTSMQVIIVQDYPNVDKIEFWLVNHRNNQQLHYASSGDIAENHINARLSRIPSIKLTLPPGESALFVRIESRGPSIRMLSVFEPSVYSLKELTEYALICTLLGMLLIMIVYNFMIYVQLRKNIYLIYISFITSVVFYSLSNTGLMIHLTDEFSFWMNQGFTISGSMMTITAMLFAYHFLMLKRMHWVFTGLVTLSAGTAFTAFLLNFIDYRIAAKILVLMAYLGSITSFAAGVACCMKRFRPAYFYTFAWLTMIISNVARMLGYTGHLPMSYFINNSFLLGSVIEVALLSLALFDKVRITEKRSFEKISALNDDLHQESEKVRVLNENLEILVEQKTGQIRALLDYIPQGVLSIEGQGQVSSDYSAHLEDILETNDIAGRNFNDLILSRSNLSKDEQDQCWQSIIAMLGQLELAFEANRDKLPAEISYGTGENRKILKATWNVKLEEDVIQNILVTLLDSTNEKALEEVAELQRSEIKLVTELVSVSENNLAQFFATSSPLIEENLRVLNHSSQNMSNREIRLLFVNAHTVKGAARTLGLKTIANLVHVAEDTYSAIIKKEMEPDLPRMQREMLDVSEKFKEALDVNNNTLNRGNVIENVSIDRSFIEHHHTLLRNLIADPNRPVSSFLKDIEKQSAIITDIVFEKIDHIMEDYQVRAKKIAKDLGKIEPRFEVQTNDIGISYRLRLVLDKCITHILRNALDHGIEDEKERIKSGKSGQGCITFQAEVKDHSINLRIFDDGRGLAIQGLKQRGLEKGVIQRDASIAEIANVIFADQISTAKTVSLVSGRGIGMEAVKSYLESVGGTIEIVFPQAVSTEDDYVPFVLHLTIPLNLNEESIAA